METNKLNFEIPPFCCKCGIPIDPRIYEFAKNVGLSDPTTVRIDLYCKECEKKKIKKLQEDKQNGRLDQTS